MVPCQGPYGNGRLSCFPLNENRCPPVWRAARAPETLTCGDMQNTQRAAGGGGERRLADVLSAEFDPAPDVLASVLTCYDMTTGPDGQPVRVDRRLAEIQDRYGSGHLVSRRAPPMILRAVEQVHHRAAQTCERRHPQAATAAITPG